MRKLALLAALLALGAAVSEPASARGRARVSVGFVFGGPFWYPAPWYYGPPAYYYYPPHVVYSSPPVYIERQDVAATPERSADWWYYCDQSKAYYPYVKTCPGGWQKVAPAPQE